MITVRVPVSLRDAGAKLRPAFAGPIESLTTPDFVSAWCALVYVYPDIHPDDLQPGVGWPFKIKRFVAEVWRRYYLAEIGEPVVYCADAAWAGVYDRMLTYRTPEEVLRRSQLAANVEDNTDHSSPKELQQLIDFRLARSEEVKKDPRCCCLHPEPGCSCGAYGQR